MRIQLTRLGERDFSSQPPRRLSSKFDITKEKDRNPGQAASSSSGPARPTVIPEAAEDDQGPGVSAQAEGTAVAEGDQADLDPHSPVSDCTEIPPPTEGVSSEEEANPQG